MQALVLAVLLAFSQAPTGVVAGRIRSSDGKPLPACASPRCWRLKARAQASPAPERFSAKPKPMTPAAIDWR